MKLVDDESVERQIIDHLRRSGHTVLAIAEIAPRADDSTVLSLAHDRRAILITGDKDFGELVFRQRQHSSGIVLLRLSGVSNEAKAASVLDAFEAHGPKLVGAFAVVSPGQIRIRDHDPSG